MKREYEGLDTHNETEQVCPSCGDTGGMVYLDTAHFWMCKLCRANSGANAKTPEDFESKRKALMSIDIDGFDPEWVLERFGREASLRTVQYARAAATDEQYAMLIRYFKTGNTGRFTLPHVLEVYHTVVLTYYEGDDVDGVGVDEAIDLLNSIADDYLSYLVPNKGSSKLN